MDGQSRDSEAESTRLIIHAPAGIWRGGPIQDRLRRSQHPGEKQGGDWKRRDSAIPIAPSSGLIDWLRARPRIWHTHRAVLSQVTLTASWPPNVYQVVWRAVTPEHIRLSEFQFPTVMARNPRVGGCNLQAAIWLGWRSGQPADLFCCHCRPLARRDDLGPRLQPSQLQQPVVAYAKWGPLLSVRRTEYIPPTASSAANLFACCKMTTTVPYEVLCSGGVDY
ncbi:hypothetical protein VTN96DRAFT_4880 [Rasamsonia emersonii]